MTVGELIAKLDKYDRAIQVFTSCHDGWERDPQVQLTRDWDEEPVVSIG